MTRWVTPGSWPVTLLSRKADYALVILSHLAQRPRGGNARAIAEQYGLSRAFVANILKELCHAGYVSSHRGVKGGYAARPEATGRTLADLLEAVDERFRLTTCSTAGSPADACALEADCPVKGPLADIHRRIVDVLRGVTLGRLLAAPADRPDALLTLLPVLSPAAGTRCSGAGCPPEPTPV